MIKVMRPKPADATAIKPCKIPPLPRLMWNGYQWEAKVTLPSWAGFQSRGGPYTSRSRRRPSTGRVTLNVKPSGNVDGALPSEIQVAAFAYLVEHEQAIYKAAIARVLREYPRQRRMFNEQVAEEFGDDDEEDGGFVDPDMPRPLPTIGKAAGLRDVMGLGIVHILDEGKNGVAYIGFELGCDWDDEHGAGVLMHRNRVVAFGSGDVSFRAP